MKTKLCLTIFAAAAALQLAPLTFAQAKDDQAGWQRHGRRAHLLANLSADERVKLRAANQKAMADPAVQAAKERARQARKDFRSLKRAALLRADPSLQPILDKIPERGGKQDS
ncbi:MAG: hypothetical protein M3119_05045 [Verrucomicrobiota bacterium]|nr:hypothetical protein [Verrucomicrobiota bacterium]